MHGIIITSGKADFAGGMDLNVLARMKEAAGDDPARGLFDGVMAIHRLLRKIERAGMDPKTLKGGKPIAWAAPGTSAGIGTEIGLACHRRFIADNPKAKVGLPEILVGIFPGAGGTTRLVRMLGVMAAAPMLLEGKMLAPKAAKAAGLVDEVVARRATCIQNAKDWVLARQGRRHRQALGRQGLQDAGRRAVLAAGLHDLSSAPRRWCTARPKGSIRRRRRCCRRPTRARWSISTPRSGSRRAGSPRC